MFDRIRRFTLALTMLALGCPVTSALGAECAARMVAAPRACCAKACACGQAMSCGCTVRPKPAPTKTPPIDVGTPKIDSSVLVAGPVVTFAAIRIESGSQRVLVPVPESYLHADRLLDLLATLRV